MTNLPVGIARTNSTLATACFDPIGIIVDWLLRAARGRFYDNGAIVGCCQGGNLPRTARRRKVLAFEVGLPATGAFEVDALLPETDAVCLDYRVYDGTLCVRTSHSLRREKSVISASIEQAA